LGTRGGLGLGGTPPHGFCKDVILKGMALNVRKDLILKE
jgi:hypothetical protein